jgi:GT2 family glycosyltransferase
MEEKSGVRGTKDQAMVRGTERGFVIVVARNSLHLTKKAVASAAQQNIPCDILLIDNASSDGTAQWVATKPITRIFMIKQAALAECWNVGLSAAWSIGRTHALVVNNDIELRADAYRLLLAHGGPFVTCVSVDSADRMGVVNDREAVDFAPRPHPDFSAFMIHREVTDKVGWFNEDYYPAYCEDAEYHVRMHRAGVEAVCVDVPFLHHGAATVKNSDPAEKIRIQRGADVNRERFRQIYGCLPGSSEYYALFREQVSR